MTITDLNPKHSDRLESLLKKLKASGLRMTPQRLAILRTLVVHPGGHPSVDELHQTLLPDFPSMSLATVYKTITMLKQMDEVLELEFSHRDNRFDGNKPHPHPHLICTKCGKIMDADIPGLPGIIDGLNSRTGYFVTSHRLDFHGECPHCRQGN